MRTRTAVLLTLGILLTACGSPAPTPGPQSTEPTSSSSPATSTTAPTSAAPAIDVDDTLLSHLPAQIDGRDLVADSGTAEDLVTDPGLSESVSALAIASAFGPEDYVVATVVRLRDGVFGDEFYRSWRDTYDKAVCAQAGGVEQVAIETTIGDRPTFIGTCGGGVHTYHVYLPGPDVLVSMQALGDRRYGELVVAGLNG